MLGVQVGDLGANLESRRSQLGLNLGQLGHKWDELDSLDQQIRKKIRKNGVQDWELNVQGLEVECYRIESALVWRQGRPQGR